MKPKVSVIIPAYNAEKTLKRCLDSVFAQDFDSYEVILVNDGSTDGTLEVARRYEEYPDFVLVNQPNGGVARARWAGILASKGDYLAFVDSDDYIAPDMMAKMYLKVQETGAEVVICGVIRVNKGEMSLYRCYKEGSESGVFATEKIMKGIINGSLWNKLFSKHLFLEYEYKMTTGIKYGEDQLLLAPTVARAKTVAYLEDILYFYVENPDSATNRPKIGALEDLAKVRSLLFEFYTDPMFSAWNNFAPYFYILGLIDILRMLNRVEKAGDGRKLRSDIRRKLLDISLPKIEKSRRLHTLFDIFLVRVGLFRLIYTVWEGPLFKPLRSLKRDLIK